MNSVKVEVIVDVLLPGITIDIHLTFKQHDENLCQKVQHELHALRHIRNFLTIQKADSQFNFAPLLWMFCRKTVYSKIEKIHQKT